LFDCEIFELKIITKKIKSTQIKKPSNTGLYISAFFEQHHRAKQEEEEEAEEAAKLSNIIMHWEEQREFVTCNKTRGVTHPVTLPFTLKSVLMQKKNYEKFKHFTPCKNVIFKKIL
jgi:hypothetical protein